MALIPILALFGILHVKAHHTGLSTWTYTHPTQGEIFYWFVSSYQNAADSNEACTLNGGMLAYIPNQDALTVVVDLLNAKSFTSVAFVGYTKVNDTHLEIQGSGHLQSWFTWDYGQPGGIDQTCIGLLGSSGEWHDYYCTQETTAVCSTPYVASNTRTTSPTSTTITTISTSTDPSVITTSGPPDVITTSANPDVITTSGPPGVITTSSPPDCLCQCDESLPIVIYPITNITEELQTKLDSLRKETQVDEETLSSTIRKRTSVSDSRPSSAYVGYLGVGLLTLIFGGILLLDLPRVIMLFTK